MDLFRPTVVQRVQPLLFSLLHLSSSLFFLFLLSFSFVSEFLELIEPQNTFLLTPFHSNDSKFR